MDLLGSTALYLAHWEPLCLAHFEPLYLANWEPLYLAQGCYRIWHRIVHFEPDIEKVFLELFQPMRLSRTQFRKLVRHSILQLSLTICQVARHPTARWVPPWPAWCPCTLGSATPWQALPGTAAHCILHTAYFRQQIAHCKLNNEQWTMNNEQFTL